MHGAANAKAAHAIKTERMCLCILHGGRSIFFQNGMAKNDPFPILLKLNTCAMVTIPNGRVYDNQTFRIIQTSHDTHRFLTLIRGSLGGQQPAAA